jgi:hypothetical protein
MSKLPASLIFVVGALAVIIVFIVVSSNNNAWLGSANPIVDAATALAVMTGAALVIERVMEGAWTIIDMTLGLFWPLNLVGEIIDAQVAQWNAQLQSFADAFQKKVDGLPATNPAQVDAATKALTDFNATLTKIKSLPGPQYLQYVASWTQSKLDLLNKEFNIFDKDTMETYGQWINTAEADVNSFSTAFAQNPARTLISLFVGATAGLLVAKTFGLNAYQAVISSPPVAATVSGQISPQSLSTATLQLPGIWIGITGLVMGLGTSPTHQLIQTLTQFKSRLKTPLA